MKKRPVLFYFLIEKTKKKQRKNWDFLHRSSIEKIDLFFGATPKTYNSR